ncbi:MAG: hypothetical protein HQL01_10600 [Nitrospirae bacterium]|nr:hypothetical protein [Nitrospirota bacterium]
MVERILWKTARHKIISIVALVVFVAITAGCGNVEKPAVGAKGEAALQVPQGIVIFPWYHQKDTITSNHMNLLNKGKVKEANCLPCHHNPDQFCNKCHEYVGAAKVMPGKTYKDILGLEMPAPGIPAPPGHTPIDTWKTAHDEAIIYGKEPMATCAGCHPVADNFCNKCHENAGIRKIKY